MNQWWGEWGSLVSGEEEGLVALVGWVGVILRLATVARRRAEVLVGGDMVAEGALGSSVVEDMLAGASASVVLDMLKDCGLEVVGCWFEG